jgi:DMSO/TMAO reductase YedYZ molybdopterin-dependent catalytic subunit
MLDRLRGLPQHDLTMSMRSPRGTFQRSFKGALLSDYAAAVGLLPRPAPPIGPGNFYFLATAADGFKVAMSYSEVAPRSSGKQVLLAYEQDGEPVRAGVRLVVPGDDLGGRSIVGVESLELRSVESIPHADRPVSAQLKLGGLLERPQTLDAGALAALDQVEVETMPTPRHGGGMMPPRRYRGVPLFHLLERTGMKLDPDINEDVLSKVVVARGSDGLAAVVAAGEIEPRFMAGQVIVATSCDGLPLAEDGQFRLVVPYDKVIGRSLKCLTAIDLIQA